MAGHGKPVPPLLSGIFETQPIFVLFPPLQTRQTRYLSLRIIDSVFYTAPTVFENLI